MCEPIQIPADGPKILFTSPWGPYAKRAVEDDPVDYFYYRNTLKQGPFQLRIFQSWHCLHFMAQNLPVESTVLENPSPEEFKRELREGNYQIVALSFTQILLGKVMEMARWLKRSTRKSNWSSAGLWDLAVQGVLPADRGTEGPQ